MFGCEGVRKLLGVKCNYPVLVTVVLSVEAIDLSHTIAILD